MPFTGSHPAAVLPLLGTRLPASALVAGSLAPDLPYYLPVDLGRPTHTAAAVVTVDLLLGALLWAGWHALVSAPALDVAPRALRARLVGRVRTGLRPRSAPGALGLALLAVVVGAATHVGWDEFTHPGRFGAEHVGLLAETWAGRPGYRWAQEVSGVLGAAALTGWLVRWWRRTPPSPLPEDRPGRWWPLLLVTAVAVLGGAGAAVGAGDLRSAAVAAAFRGGGLALAAVVLLALGRHVRQRSVAGRRRTSARRDPGMRP